jgi:hypothetical protein
MLALAEQLCRQEQPYSLEFVAFTNEEYLPLGDDEYVHRRGNTFDQIDAVFNFDAVGLRQGPNTVAGFNLNPQRTGRPGAQCCALPGGDLGGTLAGEQSLDLRHARDAMSRVHRQSGPNRTIICVPTRWSRSAGSGSTRWCNLAVSLSKR